MEWMPLNFSKQLWWSIFDYIILKDQPIGYWMTMIVEAQNLWEEIKRSWDR